MRDWTVVRCWLSMLSAFWLYKSSSLALSSTYWNLGNPLTNNIHYSHHHHHHSFQSHATLSSATSNGRSKSTTRAMGSNRGKGDEGHEFNPLLDNDDDDDKAEVTATLSTTTVSRSTTTTTTTGTMSKWTSKLKEKGRSFWSSQKASWRETNATSSSLSLSSSSSSLFPIRLSKKYHWDHLSQRLQQYRRKGGRFLLRKTKTLSEQQLSFLEHMALVSTAFWNQEKEALLENITSPTTLTSKSSSSSLLQSLRRRKVVTVAVDNATLQDVDDDSRITAQSDLTLPGRHITIVTTAALPWMTGTAVNPLLRAANLVRRTREINDSPTQQWITLVVPWLELTEDQQEVYQRVFSGPQEQEDYIRNWLRKEAGLADVADAGTGLKIIFYPARYHSGLRSVFAMGDICSLIPNDEADVCILEEPEHCNWYRAPGDGWTRKFHYVVGVVHTNYQEYASAAYHGLWTAPALAVISSAMVRAYCHKVIKLSDVLQSFAPEKEVTSNVHGVRSDFLEEGLRRSQQELERRANGDAGSKTTSGVYFIGKLLWTKGLDLLLELEDYYKECTGDFFSIDVYGSGPDEKEIRRAYLGPAKPKQQQQPLQPSTARPRRFLVWDRRRSWSSRIQAASTEQDVVDAETEGSSSSDSRLATQQLHNVSSQGAVVAVVAEKDLVNESLGYNAEEDTWFASFSSLFARERPDNIQGTVKSTTESTTTREKNPSNEPLTDSAEVDKWLASFSSLFAPDRPVDVKETIEPTTTESTKSVKTKKEPPLNESLGDNAEFDTWLASFSSLFVRERLDEIKATIKSTTESIEIPRTLYDLRRSPVPATFPGRVDHSTLKESYKIFVNPSISEVLCTTTAEALAMGKFAIIPVHPSNVFFYQFPNCLAYRSKFEFVSNLRYALTHEPEPLTPELARAFSWEAATDRLIEASTITLREAREREKLGLSKLDESIAWFHNELGKGAKGDLIRQVMGGGPASHQVKYQIQMQQLQPEQQQQLLLLSKAELESLNSKTKVSSTSTDGSALTDEDDDDDDSDDNDDEGLTQKFRSSSFVRAIRSTIANSFPGSLVEYGFVLACLDTLNTVKHHL